MGWLFDEDLIVIAIVARGICVDVKITYVGLRPGEKLNEELVAPGEKIMRRIDSKICVVDGPAPAESLLVDVEELRRAAAAEDHQAVLHQLQRLVPDYRPLTPTATGSGEWVAEDAAVM